MSIGSLLLTLIVVCAFLWAARKLMTAFGIVDPLATVIWVILVLLILSWLLSSMGGSLGSLRIGR